MNALAVVAKVAGISVLMGTLLGAYAWSYLGEPLRTRVLRQTKWLVVPGFVGTALWAGILAYGIFVHGCDPLFGGWARTPLSRGFPSSELLACSDRPLQARVKPELASRYPSLPVRWARVYRHYEEAAAMEPDSSRVWILPTQGNELLHVRKDRLEFRAVPEKRGGLLWWQPQEAAETW
jgi:hypothetical protein